MTTFAIVDLETTGNAASKGDRIIEIGVVVVTEEGRTLEEFSSLVYPEREIPPFVSSLTGIKEEDVLEAPLFSEIAEDIHPLFDHAYIVAHNIEFDLGFLNDEFKRCGLPPLHNPIIDTVEFARLMLPTSPTFKLGQLAERLGLGHDRPHRALSDAQVTSDLLLYLLGQMEGLPEKTLDHLIKVEPKLKSDFRPFLIKYMEGKRYGRTVSREFDIHHGIPIRKQLQRSTDVSGTRLLDFRNWKNQVYEGNEGLKSIVQGYENRAGQKEMTDHVYRALENKRHAIIEAGTGTGKSVAYLLASAFHALKEEKRVVITTYTTSLQKQLLEDEIPKIERMFPRPLKAVLYKGKGHYISLVHFRYELEHSSQDNYDIALTKGMILVWLTRTRTGDVDEIQLPSNGRQFWHKVSAEQSSKNVQLGYIDDSFFQWAQKRALEADLIITNHALFCMDMVREDPVLPEYSCAVVDEAHHLESVANRYFGVRMDYKELQRHLSQCGEIFQKGMYRPWKLPTGFSQHLRKGQYAVDEAKEELSQLSKYIHQNVKKEKRSDKGRSDVGRMQFLLQPSALPSFITTAKEMSHRFLAAVQKMVVQMSAMEEKLATLLSLKEDNGIPVVITRIQTQLELCRTVRLELIHYFDLDQDEVKWIEIEGEGAANSIYLFSEPFDVAGLLQRKLFHKKESVVLTSATLATDHSFDYMRRSLGLDLKETMEVQIPSPYDYRNQVQVMVPNDFPSVKDDPESFIEAISEAVYSIAQVTKGRMLVLFTSYDMLKKTYLLLKEFIDPEEFMIFAQGISSGSRDRLKKNFQAFDQSILLGTSSFWEGVDIPGDDLSCVMMVKLPFQPPDQPVQAVRKDRFKKEGRNSFMEKSLPNAIIRFKQGFGRLIRSDSDRGIIFICDQRLMEAKYGKHFLDSLPEVPVSYQSTRQLIDKIENWL
ncbi:ATP-dependent DNA helicase DinG [Halobacillus sp. ACCC02827]|uniref:ATP-dependent DNA helicase DinG n=1 Tax=Halobacillus sp. ACCC02827 TaxID=3052090 RepID=UPI002570D5A0|nr:ATP-dependent DNA helicase DinG [Halobacillus sp. ACCC02827]WJE14066.1 ATP-dependent DNA helicase DinG [Halobacillus sp. ACCC02827]